VGGALGAALVVVGLATTMLVVFLSLLPKKKPGPGADVAIRTRCEYCDTGGVFPNIVKNMTGAEADKWVAQRLERATENLNLWTRLAVARGMRVDMEIAKADPDDS